MPTRPDESSLMLAEHLAKIDELGGRLKVVEEQYKDLQRRYQDSCKQIFRNGVRGHAMKALPGFSKLVITDERKWAECMYERAEMAGGLDDLEEVLAVLQARMEDLLISLPARQELIPMPKKVLLFDLNKSEIARFLASKHS